MVKIEDMIEVMQVGTGDNIEYGRNIDGVITYGFYIRAKKDTLLKKVENTAKGKFRLECDNENYIQEARRVFFEKIKDYEDNNRAGNGENVNGYLFRACQNELTKIAQRTKGNVTQYNEESGEYLIANLLSLEATDDNGNYIYEGEINKAIEEKKVKSSSVFLEWFNANRSEILTKKQQQYLLGEVEVLPNNRARMNKSICERVYKKYTKENILKHRIEITTSKINIVKNILDSNTEKQLMLRLTRALTKNDWLLDVVYSLSSDTCKMITSACKGRDYVCKKECVSEIREALTLLKNYFTSIIVTIEKKCKK